MRKGFTLIELLVVITIIGILATIGIASFNNAKYRAQIAKGFAFETQATTKLELESISDNENWKIAAYDFNEGTGTSSEDSMNNFDISIHNSPTTPIPFTDDTPDQSAYSFDLSGQKLRMTMGDAVDGFPHDRVTISVWAKIDDAAFSSGHLTNRALVKSQIWGIYLLQNGQPRFDTYHISVAPDRYLDGPVGVVKPDQWNHYLATYDEGERRLYVNGELVASDTIGVFDFDYDHLTFIQVGDNNPFTGHIDRVKIYPVQLDF